MCRKFYKRAGFKDIVRSSASFDVGVVAGGDGTTDVMVLKVDPEMGPSVVKRSVRFRPEPGAIPKGTSVGAAAFLLESGSKCGRVGQRGDVEKTLIGAELGCHGSGGEDGSVPAFLKIFLGVTEQVSVCDELGKLLV